MADKPQLQKSTVMEFRDAWEKSKAIEDPAQKQAAQDQLRRAYITMQKEFDPPPSMDDWMDKLVDVGLRVADYPSGFTRLAVGSATGQYKEGDAMRALKGQAPTTGEYLERMGVPEGPTIASIGKLKLNPRDIAGMVGDVAISPGVLGLGKVLSNAKKAFVGTPVKYGAQTARELRLAQELAANAPPPSAWERVKSYITTPAGAKLADEGGESLYQSAFAKENKAARDSFVQPLGEQAAERGYPVITSQGKAKLVQDVINEQVPRRNFLRSELASRAPDKVVPGSEIMNPTGAYLDMSPVMATAPIIEGGLGLRQIQKGLKGERAIPIAGGAAEDSLKFFNNEFKNMAKRPKTGLEGSGGPWARMATKNKEWAVPANQKQQFVKWVKDGNPPKKFPGVMKYEDYVTARLSGYDVKEMSQIADAAQDVAKAKGMYQNTYLPQKGSPAKNIKNNMSGERLGEAAKDVGFNARRIEEEMADQISQEAQQGAALTGGKTPVHNAGGEIRQRNQKIGGAAAAAPIIEEANKQTLWGALKSKGPSVSAGGLAYLFSQNPYLAALATGGVLGASTSAGRTLGGKMLKGVVAPASVLARPALLEHYSDKRRGGPSLWDSIGEDLAK